MISYFMSILTRTESFVFFEVRMGYNRSEVMLMYMQEDLLEVIRDIMISDLKIS